jgi:tripartite-type tricarboxylate transporter receptor subunit TctC
MNDIVANHLPSGWTSTASAMPHMSTGKVRVLACSTATRTPFFPEVPTVQEQGIPEFDLAGWVALLAPKGLAPAVAEQLFAALQLAYRDEALKTRFTAMGIEADLRPAPALLEAMRREDRIWATAAAAGHVKAQ